MFGSVAKPGGGSGVVLGRLRIFDFEDFNCFFPSIWVVVHDKVKFNIPYMNTVTHCDHCRNHEAATGGHVACDMWVVELKGQEINLDHVSFGQILVRGHRDHIAIDAPRAGMCNVYRTPACINQICTGGIVT